MSEVDEQHIMLAKAKVAATQKVLDLLERCVPEILQVEILAAAIEAIVGPVNINIRTLPDCGSSKLTHQIAQLFKDAEKLSEYKNGGKNGKQKL